MGDPGVAKSQLLSYIDRLAPRSAFGPAPPTLNPDGAFLWRPTLRLAGAAAPFSLGRLNLDLSRAALAREVLSVLEKIGLIRKPPLF